MHVSFAVSDPHTLTLANAIPSSLAKLKEIFPHRLTAFENVIMYACNFVVLIYHRCYKITTKKPNQVHFLGNKRFDYAY